MSQQAPDFWNRDHKRPCSFVIVTAVEHDGDQYLVRYRRVHIDQYGVLEAIGEEFTQMVKSKDGLS